MTEPIKSWFQENSTLIYFLAAQAVAIGAAAASILAYSVRLETRVSIMETRGAEYTVERLGKIDQRLTVLEQAIHKNTASIERIIDVMTRELKK
jgi:hypothetical protein